MNLGASAGPFVIGWIKQATGSITWGLLAVAGGVLMSGIIALLIGHDSAAEHGTAAAAGDAAAFANSANTPGSGSA